MALPERFVLDLKLRCNLEEIISPYVQLHRRGSNLVGLCPFHSEKTGSFTVYPATQNYYCFGCGAGGDVITFIRSVEHLDYIDAVRFLAEKNGVEMPEEEKGEQNSRKLRARILELNKTAAHFFHAKLLSEEGEEARAYLKDRQLTGKIIKKFGLGYAPNSWDSLLHHLVEKGYSQEEIRNAGLCVRGKSGGFYDYFRHRMMVPILDVRGNVIAFGGRVLDNSQPKYLNSPDTPVFKKSNNLFNLNQAKGSGAGRLILAEGYMDVIAMCQAGFSESVATLGTAITEEQARMIARYSGNGEVIIAYDSDIAGQKATAKAIKYLEAAGATVRVLQMQGGKDPDEYIKKFGADRFSMLLEQSGNQVEYKLAAARGKYQLENENDRVEYLKEAVIILSTVGNAITRDVYAGRLAKELEVSKDSIIQEVDRSRKAYQRRQKNNTVREEQQRIFAKRDRINPEKAEQIKAARAEEGLISILFFYPEMVERIDELILPADFITAFNKRIYEAIHLLAKAGETPDTGMLGEQFSTEEMGRIAGLLAEGAPFLDTEELWRAVEDYVGCIHGEKYELRPGEAKTKNIGEIETYIREGLGKKKGKGR